MTYMDMVIKAMKLSGVTNTHDNEQDSDNVSRYFNVLKDLISNYNADANLTFEKDIVKISLVDRQKAFGENDPYIPRLAPLIVYSTSNPSDIYTQFPLEALMTRMRFNANAYSFDVASKASSLIFSDSITTTEVTAIFKKPIREDGLVTDNVEVAPPLVDYLARKLALEICNIEGIEPTNTLVASIREASNRFANQKMSQNKIITFDMFPSFNLYNGHGI